jgi:parallel beta-helix repeat protein
MSIVIENKTYSNASGNAISLANKTSVTIRNCIFSNLTGIGIALSNCSNILITNCKFDKVLSGAYLVNCKNITMTHCTCTNITGPVPRGQIIQLNGCSTTGNIINLIQYNVVNDSFNYGQPEDIINIFNSSNVLVDSNYLQGFGSDADGSKTGSGINLGNNGGHNLTASNNYLYNTGGSGLSLCGGTNILAENNKIFSQKNRVSGSGIQLFEWHNSIPTNVTIKNNTVGWFNKKGNQSSYWTDGTSVNVVLQSNTFNQQYPSSIIPIPQGWGCSL